MSHALTAPFGPYQLFSARAACAYVRAQYPIGCGVEAYARPLAESSNSDAIPRVIVDVDLYDEADGAHVESMEWIVDLVDGAMTGFC